MSSDIARPYAYSQRMRDQPAHLILTIETKEPIEIGDFVKAFTSIAEEYRRHIRETDGATSGEAEIYVRQVREGSIIADLIPTIAPFIGAMDGVLILEDFVRRYGSRITALITGDREKEPDTKAQLQTFSDAVQAIANDPNGTATLEAAVFTDGKKEIHAAFKFDTSQGRIARQAIEDRKLELDKVTGADHTRVLMVFTRSDVHDAAIGKPSGERVKIEEISDKELALSYGSQLAEEKIKHEIREERIYKLGFVVDVNVRFRDGKPVVYAVTHVHQIIDLSDD